MIVAQALVKIKQKWCRLNRSSEEGNMHRFEYGNWVPGSVIRVYSKRHNVWHFGIADWLNGHQPTVLHGSKDRGQFVRTTL